MAGDYVVGYATIMDQANARKLGLASQPELVTVTGMQRWFGFPDLAGRTLEDVFDTEGVLQEQYRDLASTTIAASPSHSFNAVVFGNVSRDVLDRLDCAEAESYLDRISIPPEYIKRFRDESPWGPRENAPVWAYAARSHITVPRRGSVRLVRQDVTYNNAYLRRCMAAAKVHGGDFLSRYMVTTYLADRQTPIAAVVR